jgi:hypothetical protein
MARGDFLNDPDSLPGPKVQSGRPLTVAANRGLTADEYNALRDATLDLHDRSSGWVSVTEKRFAGGADPTGVADSTAAFNAAIQAASTAGTVHIPAGSYLHTGLVVNRSARLVGAGWQKTILVNTHPTAPSIWITNQPPGLPTTEYMVGGPTVTDLQITGAGTGAGVLFNTQTHAVLRTIHILNVGGHGVQVGDGTQHVYGLTLEGVVVQYAAGDGVYGRGKWLQQVNAINIHGGEFVANRHGINLFATNVNVRDAIIEGNLGYGILISGAGSPESYTASSLAYEGNYLEDNALGAVKVEVGDYGGGVITYIRGLVIHGNYIFANGMVPGTTPAVSFAKIGSVPMENGGAVGGLTFADNHLGVDPANALLSTTANFGETLDPSCIVEPAATEVRDETTASSLEARYLNLGVAEFRVLPKRLVIPGLFLAKGAFAYTSVTSTGTAHSESVVPDATAKVALFPVLLPQGSIILAAGVHVITDSTNYTVEVTISQRDPRGGASAWTTLTTYTAAAQSGAKFIDTGSIDAFLSDSDPRRIKRFGEDVILKIVVTGANGTTFQLGNPIIRYN